MAETSPGKYSNIDMVKLPYTMLVLHVDQAWCLPAYTGALMLPQSNQWNIYVCCVNSSVDVIVRLVGEGYSVSAVLTVTTGSRC